MKWNKNDGKDKRRRVILLARPKNWSIKKKYLTCARILQCKCNSSKNDREKILAKKDADYFFKKAKKIK